MHIASQDMDDLPRAQLEVQHLSWETLLERVSSGVSSTAALLLRRRDDHHCRATLFCGIVLVLRPRRTPDQPALPAFVAAASQSAAAPPAAALLKWQGPGHCLMPLHCLPATAPLFWVARATLTCVVALVMRPRPLPHSPALRLWPRAAATFILCCGDAPVHWFCTSMHYQTAPCCRSGLAPSLDSDLPARGRHAVHGHARQNDNAAKRAVCQLTVAFRSDERMPARLHSSFTCSISHIARKTSSVYS